jgi:hypothetical protein
LVWFIQQVASNTVRAWSRSNPQAKQAAIACPLYL